MSSILQTKIQLPPLRDQHILRDHLVRRIQREAMTKLVLVSAPAGFGKSSSLIEWAHHQKREDTVVAWYALDDRDNDPARFAAYLLASCDVAYTDSPTTSAGEQIDLHGAVDHVLNRASRQARSLVLILDDYHLITEPQIHDAIGRMCDHMPSNMRLAIGTRADPPLQLARLRARGEMVEIRMSELRFARDEMRDWLQAALGWQPSADFLLRLDSLTEGWAAAITLILTGDAHDEAALEQQIARYSQSQRHIFDYFAQEILDQQPDDLRRFLLDTCVLDHLEPESCRTLTGNANAPLLLERLAAKNLFVIPLSDDAPVYRYHHLFVQFLRQHLMLQDVDLYYRKHREAAGWFAERGQVVTAVPHALASGDYAYAAGLITDSAWEALTRNGEIMTMIRWLARFPDDEMRLYPRLSLYFSRALYLAGDAEKSQHYVQMATNALADQVNQPLQAIAYSYQATLAAYRGEVTTGRHWIEQANALRDHVSGVDRVRIANTDAFLHYLTADIPAARASYEYALSLAADIPHDFLALDAHFYLAQIDLLAGQLQAVEDRCTALLARYTKRIPPLAAIMVPLARVQYQRDRPIQAEATLRDAIKLAQRANLPDILWLAYINLANVLSAAEVDGAVAILGQAHTIARDYRSPVMVSIIAAAEALLMLRGGHLDEAVVWADSFQPSGQFHQQYETTILARIRLAQGRYAEAHDILAGLIEESQQHGRMWYVIAGNLLRAVAYRAAGDRAAALVSLERALNYAQPHGFVRLLVDEGQPVLDLLDEAVRQGIAVEYAAHLLENASNAKQVQHPADVLTEREREVLAHIAAGASNNDIAAALVLSVGTVKSHIHHIMNKLDAQNRTEAVSKARSLNILPD